MPVSLDSDYNERRSLPAAHIFVADLRKQIAVQDPPERCHICQEDFLPDNESRSDEARDSVFADRPVRLPVCGHVFGLDCLLYWILCQNHPSSDIVHFRRDTCPICRDRLFQIEPQAQRARNPDSDSDTNDNPAGLAVILTRESLRSTAAPDTPIATALASIRERTDPALIARQTYYASWARQHPQLRMSYTDMRVTFWPFDQPNHQLRIYRVPTPIIEAIRPWINGNLIVNQPMEPDSWRRFLNAEPWAPDVRVGVLRDRDLAYTFEDRLRQTVAWNPASLSDQIHTSVISCFLEQYAVALRQRMYEADPYAVYYRLLTCLVRGLRRAQDNFVVPAAGVGDHMILILREVCCNLRPATRPTPIERSYEVLDG